MAGTYIVLMGVQGAGKGTQAKELVEKLRIPHITTGDMFRAMDGQDTPLAREIQAIMKAGKLVPDDITIQVVRERLKQPDVQKGAIFDGFPRTRAQAEALDKLLAEIGGKVTVAPTLNLPKEAAIKRITDRWVCSQNKDHIYNLTTKPPQVAGKCDYDNAPLMQRKDDTPEAAATRINLYFEETAPVLDYYRERSILYEIDANQPPEVVTANLLAAIDHATKAASPKS